MALQAVHLASDVYLVCLTHALSTEKEEIMGLLIGDIDEKRVCHVLAVIVLQRSDKQVDRVEISPEQLSAASSQAENLAHQLQRPMRVVGWYHSHPHITVWPSHVDVQTQAMYQMLDEGFVGLIYSVFNEKKQTRENRIQLTCFQSINQSPEGEAPQYMRLEVPLHIVPKEHISRPCLDSLVDLPRIISEEEEEAYTKTTQIPNLDLVAKIQNGSVYSKALCHFMDVLTGPMMQSLENRLAYNKERQSQLEMEKQQLLKLVEEGGQKSDLKSTSM